MIFDDNSKIFLSNLHKKTYVVGAHLNHLGEAILMSTHNIGLYEEINKIIT